MAKKLTIAALNGALIGIAISYLTAIGLSLYLQLGYFLPYIASLPEKVGGEMNAVILQTGVCALLGAGVGLAYRLLRWKPWPLHRRALGGSISLLAAVLAAGSLVIGFMG